MDSSEMSVFIGQNKVTRSYVNFRKHFICKVMIIFFLGLVPFIHACENPESMKERELMGMTMTNLTPDATKPPIDASAPVETEMATFAMG